MEPEDVSLSLLAGVIRAVGDIGSHAGSSNLPPTDDFHPGSLVSDLTKRAADSLLVNCSQNIVGLTRQETEDFLTSNPSCYQQLLSESLAMAVNNATVAPPIGPNDSSVASSTILVTSDVRYDVAAQIVIWLFVGTAIILTVVGNAMVLVAFWLNKELQNVSNYFLLSLAVADLAIGTISMPLYTSLELYGWQLGPLICDIWLSVDYMASNASALNLLVISIDRYLSVTRPLTYMGKRTPKRAFLMISAAWIISLLMWPPWIMLWPVIAGRKNGPEECGVEFLDNSDSIQNRFISIVTIALAFYIPVGVMSLLYYKIFRATRKRQEELKQLQANLRKTLRSKRQKVRKPPSALANAIVDSTSPVVRQLTHRVRSEQPRQAVEQRKSIWLQIKNTVSGTRRKSEGIDSDPSSAPYSPSHASNQTFATLDFKIPNSQRNSDAYTVKSVKSTEPADEHRMRQRHSEPSQREQSEQKPQSVPQRKIGCVTEGSENPKPRQQTPKHAYKSPDPSIFRGKFKRLKTPITWYYADDDDDQSNTIDSNELEWDEEESDEMVETRSRCQSYSEGETPRRRATAPRQPRVQPLEPTVRRQESMPVGRSQYESPEHSSPNATTPLLQQQPNISQPISPPKKARASIVPSVSRKSRDEEKQRRRTERKQEQKAARTLSAILLAFILTWLPYSILIVAMSSGVTLEGPAYKFYVFSYWLCYINSTINPVLYGVCNVNFRRAFYRILTCQFKRRYTRYQTLNMLKGANLTGVVTATRKQPIMCNASPTNTTRFMRTPSRTAAHHQIAVGAEDGRACQLRPTVPAADGSSGIHLAPLGRRRSSSFGQVDTLVNTTPAEVSTASITSANNSSKAAQSRTLESCI